VGEFFLSFFTLLTLSAALLGPGNAPGLIQGEREGDGGRERESVCVSVAEWACEC
jgi:hypothetical protein